jgi:hypothetical protein
MASRALSFAASSASKRVGRITGAEVGRAIMPSAVAAEAPEAPEDERIPESAVLLVRVTAAAVGKTWACLDKEMIPSGPGALRGN